MQMMALLCVLSTSLRKWYERVFAISNAMSQSMRVGYLCRGRVMVGTGHIWTPEEGLSVKGFLELVALWAFPREITLKCNSWGAQAHLLWGASIPGLEVLYGISVRHRWAPVGVCQFIAFCSWQRVWCEQLFQVSSSLTSRNEGLRIVSQLSPFPFKLPLLGIFITVAGEKKQKQKQKPKTKTSWGLVGSTV